MGVFDRNYYAAHDDNCHHPIDNFWTRKRHSYISWRSGKHPMLLTLHRIASPLTYQFGSEEALRFEYNETKQKNSALTATILM
jgi:hypothetical protein